LAAGPDLIGSAFHARARQHKQDGGVPLSKGAELCVFLASRLSDGITGKLISAAWDPWKTLPEHLADLNATDVYTLRRIVPEDRGLAWREDD
jgi:3-oxoacyl-[acyl-carrier protein] reductase